VKERKRPLVFGADVNAARYVNGARETVVGEVKRKRKKRRRRETHPNSSTVVDGVGEEWWLRWLN